MPERLLATSFRNNLTPTSCPLPCQREGHRNKIKDTMGPLPEDNLPEVVMPQPWETDHDAPPQALSHSEKLNHASHASEHEREKYAVVYDPTPKLFDDNTEPKSDSLVPQPWSAASPTSGNAAPTADENNIPRSEPPTSQRTICGLKRRTFFILLAIIAVLLAAVIGGAVGGSLSKKSSESSTPQPASQQSPPATSPTTTALTSSAVTTQPSSSLPSSGSPSTTSPTATPSARPGQVSTLNNSTAPHPGLAFQAFSSTSYLGTASPIIQEEGFYDLNILARSYVWLPDGTDCCLTFCTDKTTAAGWWCETRYRPDSSGPFARVYIWCGGNDGVKNVTCS
ncbi:hypothetical protein QBC47DRAFT_395510 [Echria macrotheca]|uniref:Uncharacterized protein n=1 Tax=Echria macrotheca TaxID=438768 RepID=A0AAJ0B109_9PEZI|nr:hypothetical protein QBC47DRAFT_395510 [Echria macrotheca]